MAKNTILMIGDGMGWEIARAAAIQKQINEGKTGDKLSDFYTSGAGTGLNIQKLTGYGVATTYGTTVADSKGVFSTGNDALDGTATATGVSPLRPGFTFDPTFNPGTTGAGGGTTAAGAKGNLVGYDPAKGGDLPWLAGSDKEYIKRSYPDSANTATTLYTGVKSYNNAIAVDIFEQSLDTILAQAARAGKSTGLVTSVPIDHATPAAAAANVNRRSKYDDIYPALDNILQQELRTYQPDVLLGGGHPLSAPGDLLPAGVEPNRDNTYIKAETYTELSTKPTTNRYGYTFLERGKDAATVLASTAKTIDPTKGGRLLGLYGARGQNGNLPVSSANGDYSTTGLDMFSINSSKGLKQDTIRPLLPGETDASFIARERNENPTLADLTKASLEVLGKDQDGFWMMVEGGDIDWGLHDNSIDNAIGATLDFDKAVGEVVSWINANGGWDQNELIITADHDHYLTLNDDFPKLLREKGAEKLTEIDTSVEAGHYWGSKPTVAKIPDPADATKQIDDPESGKYGWGNHSNRPVPVYYQGADTQILADGVGKGYQNYGVNVPGIPGLIDQTTIYRAQTVGVNKLASDVGVLTTYNWDNRPTIGTTAKVNPKDPNKTTAGQDVKLGGFSGLRFEGVSANGNLRFVTVTDRGPNAEPADLLKDVAGNELPMILPDFQPEVDRFELNAATGKFALTQRIKLTGLDGKPLTGRPNLQNAAQGLAYTDQVPVDLFGNRLNNDPFGADLEGIAIAKDGSFWMSDEYRPAIYHFDATGRLIERLIPKGTPTATGFGTPILPEIYAQRRSNRGFEGIAIDGNKVYAFMQSGLDIPDVANDANSKAISNLRILEYDTVTKAVTGEYIYQLNDLKLADKIGDATALGNGRFLVAERDSDSSVDSYKGIFEIDISKATNLAVAANLASIPAGKTADQLTTAELTTAKITPVTKKLIANATALGYTGVEKLEGLTVVDNNTLAVINDNDFGVTLAAVPGDGTVSLVDAPVKLGLISLNKSLNSSAPTPIATSNALKAYKDNLFEAGRDQLLKISALSRSGQGIHEIGAFKVDDEKGSIDGLLPGTAGYLQAALKRAQVVSSNLTGDFFDTASSRQLSFNYGDRVQFYSIQDSTTNQLLKSIADKTTQPKITFANPTANGGSSPVQITADTIDAYKLAWGSDLIVKVEAAAGSAVALLGTGLQSKIEGRVVDLRDQTGTFTSNTVVKSSAAFNNNVGFYEVIDEAGTLANGTKVGAADYAKQAVQNAVWTLGKNVTADRDLTGGKIYAPFLIANGDAASFLATNSANGGTGNLPTAYFNYVGANTDKVEHVRLLGDNKFGFEDLFGGGDMDYNDAVIQLNINKKA